MRVDILIAGAGPAGAATALSIKRKAPDLSVCLVDPGQRDWSVGEGLPPPAAPILKELDLWDDFQAQGHLSAYQTRAAWGSPRLQANEFLFLGKGQGWTLDRPAFDALLRQRAMSVADETVDGCLTALQGQGTEWRATAAGREIAARAVIDATGRAAVASRLLGFRPFLADRLVAVVFQATVPCRGEAGVTVDAAPEGWWYSAPTAADRRVWVWMTDADLLRKQPVGDPARRNEALGRSRIMAALTDGAQFTDQRIVPAMSQRTPPSEGPQALLTVGDAASCFDPASSQGITKALRSGLFAGYALYDLLSKGDRTALQRHRAFAAAEISAYRSQHRLHYSAETRWSERTFWRRRNGGTSGH